MGASVHWEDTGYSVIQWELNTPNTHNLRYFGASCFLSESNQLPPPPPTPFRILVEHDFYFPHVPIAINQNLQKHVWELCAFINSFIKTNTERVSNRSGKTAATVCLAHTDLKNISHSVCKHVMNISTFIKTWMNKSFTSSALS